MPAAIRRGTEARRAWGKALKLSQRLLFLFHRSAGYRSQRGKALSPRLPIAGICQPLPRKAISPCSEFVLFPLQFVLQRGRNKALEMGSYFFQK